MGWQWPNCECSLAHTICHHGLRHQRGPRSLDDSTMVVGALTSSEWTFVLKLLSLTCSTLPLSIRWGSASPHVDGTATSPDSFVYASSVNVPKRSKSA